MPQRHANHPLAFGFHCGPALPAVRALRPRQLSPSSSMRHRCRLPTTAQRRRCCCPRAQCRPHEAFSSSSSRWHAAPAGVCCHCNRAVRLRRVVMSCVMLVCRSETSFILQSMQIAEAACQKVVSRVRHFAGVDVFTVLKGWLSLFNDGEYRCNACDPDRQFMRTSRPLPRARRAA